MTVENLLYKDVPVKITNLLGDMQVMDVDPKLSESKINFARTFFMNQFTFDFLSNDPLFEDFLDKK